MKAGYLSSLILILLLCSCVPSWKEKDEPVVLNFWGDSSFEWFEAEVAAPIKAKYPNITLHLQKQMTLRQAVEQKQIPDIILEPRYWQASESAELGIQADLESLVAASELDVASFEPALLESLRSPEGDLLALPFSRTHYVLQYNKDVFDLFGVPYPRDGMTWNEVLDVSNLFKGGEDKKYYGLYVTFNDIPVLASQLSLSLLDPVTNVSTLQDARWQKIFDLWMQADTPALTMEPNSMFFLNNRFTQEKSVAMVISQPYAYPDMNVGTVSLPLFDGDGRTGADSVALALSLSSSSEHKKQAFQAIEYLVSEEYQKKMAERGQYSSLKRSIVEEAFGSGSQPPVTQAIKESMYYNDLADPIQRSTRDRFIMMKAFAGTLANFIDLKVIYWDAFDKLKRGEERSAVMAALEKQIQDSVH